MAHTDSVSTGSGVLPDGYGDDRLMTLPLDGAVPEMRLGYIQLQGVPLPATAQQFVDILKRILGELRESERGGTRCRGEHWAASQRQAERGNG